MLKLKNVDHSIIKYPKIKIQAFELRFAFIACILGAIFRKTIVSHVLLLITVARLRGGKNNFNSGSPRKKNGLNF